MVNNDYRTMFTTVIGPIINYFGFHLDTNGIIKKIGDNYGITLDRKHLYVPKDGDDWFRSKDSTLIIPFNPFKIREHTLILSQFLCQSLSEKFRDEDDEYEYNGSGELIDIVKLVKRGPKSEDQLPATFNGVIYEIWCRDEHDVLGIGVDPEGNDIKAIIMCMIDVLSKHSHFVEAHPNYDKLFKYIDRCETQKDLEIETARQSHAINNQQIDLSESVADIDLDNNEEEIVVDNVKSHHNITTADMSNVWDELDFS